MLISTKVDKLSDKNLSARRKLGNNKQMDYVAVQ